MAYYPNPNGGAPIQAANDAAASSQGWAPSMGTYGANADSGAVPTGTGSNAFSSPAGGSSGGGGGASATVSGSQPANQQNLGAIAQNMLGALASGNKAAFDEAVREFNQNYSLDQQKFQASVDQYNKNLAVTAAGLTGQYNGQQTQQAQQQAFNQSATVAGLTGYYNPPGSTPGGASVDPAGFYQLSPADQAGYLASNPTREAAAAKWAQDVGAAQNAAVVAAGGQPNQGTQTLASQAQQAGLSGQYQGAPTEAARQFNVTSGQAATNEQDKQTQDYLTLLSGLRGPNDPLQYLRTLQGTPNGLSDVVNAAAGRYQLGGAASGAVAPQATIAGQIGNMNAAQNGQYGMNGNTAGGNPNVTDPNLQGLPNASQIDPRAYNQMLPSQQSALWASYQYGGPSGAMNIPDAQAMYKQSLPNYGGPTSGGMKLFTA